MPVSRIEKIAASGVVVQQVEVGTDGNYHCSERWTKWRSF
jgi:hypothetical protein